MTETAKRVFLYKRQELDDINPNQSPKQIMEHYSTVYPELINATVNGPEIKDGELHFTFASKVGEFG
jgi:PRTRC genetic system protein C